MRLKSGRKEETRKKMLEAAGRGFRSRGYAGIGVDGLAKAAGVTSGAFYSHFGSKDEAFRAALDVGLDEVIRSLPEFQKEHGSAWVKAFCDYYLSKAHRDDLECGCAMATLTPEVARSEPMLRSVYEKKMTLIARLVADGLAGRSAEDRLGRAWAMLAVLIGGLNVARAVRSAPLSHEVAAAVTGAAITAAGRARSDRGSGRS